METNVSIARGLGKADVPKRLHNARIVEAPLTGNFVVQSG